MRLAHYSHLSRDLAKDKKVKKHGSPLCAGYNVSYSIYLNKGNNERLVGEIILSRKWWRQAPNPERYNLLWQQWTPKDAFYQTVQRSTIVVNHLAGNAQLHSKIRFYQNVCRAFGARCFKYIMPTYELYGSQRLMFEQHFGWLEYQADRWKNGQQPPDEEAYPPTGKPVRLPYLVRPVAASQPRRGITLSIGPQLRATPPDKNRHNLWILKPEGLNRGRGIAVVGTLAQVDEHVRACKTACVLGQRRPSGSVDSEELIQRISHAQTSYPFIAQKYIENPLLFPDGRKFDIRCFALVKASGDFFIYSTGYLRLSSAPFQCSDDNLASHLTNNAVQKLLGGYQRFEEGNMRPLADLDAVAADRGKHYFTSVVWPQMRSAIAKLIHTIGDALLGGFRCYNCFELFGFDFMLTDAFEFKFIECNVNPCLELSGSVSWSILPGMLDYLCQLTLDEAFRPPYNVECMEKKVRGGGGMKLVYVGGVTNKCGSTYPTVYEKSLEYWEEIPADYRGVGSLYWDCIANGSYLERKHRWIYYGRAWELVDQGQ